MFVFVSDAGSGKRRLRLIAKHHAELLVHLGFYALADWLLDLFRLAACGFPSSEHLGRWSICRERLMCKRLQGLEITDLICISNQIHLKIKLDSLSTSTGLDVKSAGLGNNKGPFVYRPQSYAWT